ncbi:MAG: hypothetical protein GF331_00985 [Chitinivibrionales bacterium]|nr:hypothetical protein [Chitinivibrionales bacterium]
MSQLIRVGILGTGFMAQTHGKRLASMEGVDIGGICDLTRELGESLNQTLGTQAVAFDSFPAMLDEASLDAVYVCLPPYAHSGQVEAAAARGLHVFLEKPIALDVARGESMAAAVAKAGVVSQVGFHMRFRKSVQAFKELIDSGEAGTPTLFSGRFWCNMLGNDWWRDREKSGGQVLEQVIHIYDLALHLLGPAATVSGFMDNLCHEGADDYTIEDTSVGTVRFVNGSMASITGSNCALPEHFISDYRVACGKALLDYRTTGNWRDTDEASVYRYGGKSDMEQTQFTEDSDPFLAESEDFIQAIRNGGSTKTPITDGLAALKLVAAVVESAQNDGRAITLDPTSA